MTAPVSVSWPERYDRIVLDETDSTMAEARHRAADVRAPTWIMARTQTDARGRRGRAWANPEGNFAATLLCRPDAGPAEAALQSFTAALALHDALAAFAGPAALALKWPNDVLLNGGKVAGILLESAGHGPRVDWLAIGIGVNLRAAPAASEVEPGSPRPVSLAGEGGTDPGQDAFLGRLAACFARHEDTFRTLGFDPVRRLWLSRAARLGETVIARTAREETTGIFETVDAEGRLVLRTPQGRRAIPAAEVFF